MRPTRTDAPMPGRPRATAFATGGIGNLGPGLDVLGCAVTGIGDTVEATWSEAPGVRIVDAGHATLSDDPARHASGIAAGEVLRRAGDHRSGVGIRLHKGLPVAGGQGGSAASAVAGAVAANALLGKPLGDDELLLAALAAEERLAGRHADNIAAALLGGIILVRSLDPIDIIRLPVPAALRVVLVHPDQQLPTATARAVLPQTVTRQLALYQGAQIAAMVAALSAGDLALLGRALDDRIAEPARASLLPGFIEAKEAARQAGALGCSISGAGPSTFAFATDDAAAARIAAAMVEAYALRGVRADARVERVDERGVQVGVPFPTEAIATTR